MKWMKLTIKTITEAEDIIISDLYDIGLEGAVIEDKIPLSAWEKEQMFVDILPEEEPDDGTAYLSFFVELPETGDGVGQRLPDGVGDGVDNSYFLVSKGQPVDPEALTERVRERLADIARYTDIGEGTITLSETEDKDWMNNWKSFFHQFYIDDLLVIPSWEEVKPKDRERTILHIDPGAAFGTGMHETTRLCIGQLKKYITPDTLLLDVGTGSGILAIVSLLYGIQKAVGTDLDPCAKEAVRDNLRRNKIPEERFTLLIGNIISDRQIQDLVGYEAYDVIVANILAEVLLCLTPVVKRHLKPGGIYIMSGIIAEKKETVVEAVQEAGMEVLEVNTLGEWVSVTAGLPPLHRHNE